MPARSRSGNHGSHNLWRRCNTCYPDSVDGIRATPSIDKLKISGHKIPVGHLSGIKTVPRSGIAKSNISTYSLANPYYIVGDAKVVSVCIPDYNIGNKLFCIRSWITSVGSPDSDRINTVECRSFWIDI